MIQLVDVKKDFVVGDVRQSAIKTVSCEIKQGEFIVLSGRSGSGKSTLLNLLAGLDMPDHGQILFEGSDFAKLSDRQVSEIRLKKIGFIFQTFNLIPVLSAYENVQYPLLYLSMSAAERKERTQEILKQVGLQNFHHSLPSQLSGGQRQRVAIARALVKSPSLVLADEPTANLDVHTSEDIVALIENIFLDKKCSVVFCTHDAKMVTRGTRWLEMSDGLVVQDRSMK